MVSETYSALWRHGSAIGASVFALLVALALYPLVELNPLMLFVAAVAFSAWYGGLGPGLIATLLCFLLVNYFFVLPFYTLSIASVVAAVELGIFVVVALLISSLNASLREARRHAEVALAAAQTAQAESEAAQRRLSFLADASRVLAGSLDYDEVLENAVRLAVPERADWAVLYVIDEDAGYAPLVAAHSDPAKESLLAKLQNRPAEDHSRRHLVLRALRTGRPEIITEVTAAHQEELATDFEQQQLFRELGLGSVIVAPLMVRGRTLGALVLVSARPDRRYGEADVSLCEALASRAAIALDNSRLLLELKEAVSARDELITVVCHDLKNPLGAVQMLVTSLGKQAGHDPAPEAQSFVEPLAVIEGATIKMTRLIEELEDLERLQTGGMLQLERSEVDLVALVRRIAVEYQQVATQYRIRVVTMVPKLTGVWDAARLDRVLSNLLTNALRYSPEGSEIVVTVMQEADSPHNWAVVMVADRGIGIPEADLPYVFERFYRASNVAERISGTGIGLESAKRIVESHGGLIAVESREGEGSTFTVKLPTDAVPAM